MTKRVGSSRAGSALSGRLMLIGLTAAVLAACRGDSPALKGTGGAGGGGPGTGSGGRAGGGVTGGAGGGGTGAVAGRGGSPGIGGGTGQTGGGGGAASSDAGNTGDGGVAGATDGGVGGGMGSDQSAVVTSELIFQAAPFASCHASTIVETKDGLVAAWFGGTAEGNPDVGIWMSRLEHNSWTTPRQVADGTGFGTARYPTWNPVLFQPKTGPLLLFYKVGPGPSTWWGMMKTSDDQGATWSTSRRLPDGILGPIKNKPVQLANGDILSGSSVEGTDGWRVHFERSSDAGQTWRATAPVNDGKAIAAIQPSLLAYSDSRLQAVGRTQQDHLFETWSEDGGNTWGHMTLTALPNPNSGTDAVTLRDSRQLLVYNHNIQSATSNGGRSPLNVAVSTDGKTWQAALVLEDDPNAPNGFAYPAVIQTTDGLVHVTYTWERLRIKHVVIDPEKLRLHPIDNGVWPTEQ